MSDTQDVTYINRVLGGDASAYAKIVDQYKDKAYSLALRIVKNTEDAEEVSQDAFVKAFKALSKFKQESSFSTWFYRIVYNTALSKIKKKQLTTTALESDHYENIGGSLTASMDDLVQADRLRYIKFAIGELSAEEAALVDLYYMRDKDMNEIAVIMDMTHVNVRVKLSRTRKKLYAILQKLLKGELKTIV